MEPSITLGSKVKDKVTGQVGTVIARAEYLYEGPRICFVTTDGEKPLTEWEGERRFEVVLVPA